MLCSAWARSKPFLWAIMIPVFAGVFVSWFDLMQSFNLETTWFWKHVVGRAAAGHGPGQRPAVPRRHLQLANDGLEHVNQLLSVRTAYGASPARDVGRRIVAGAAMIFGAIRLRRWRDEG